MLPLLEEKDVVPDIGLCTASFAWERGASSAIGNDSCCSSGGRDDELSLAIAFRHTAPIGNRGIRTQATRHVDCTVHLYSLLTSPAAFADRAGDGEGRAIRG